MAEASGPGKIAVCPQGGSSGVSTVGLRLGHQVTTASKTSRPPYGCIALHGLLPPREEGEQPPGCSSRVLLQGRGMPSVPGSLLCRRAPWALLSCVCCTALAVSSSLPVFWEKQLAAVRATPDGRPGRGSPVLPSSSRLPRETSVLQVQYLVSQDSVTPVHRCPCPSGPHHVTPVSVLLCGPTDHHSPCPDQRIQRPRRLEATELLKSWGCPQGRGLYGPIELSGTASCLREAKEKRLSYDRGSRDVDQGPFAKKGSTSLDAAPLP